MKPGGTTPDRRNELNNEVKNGANTVTLSFRNSVNKISRAHDLDEESMISLMTSSTLTGENSLNECSGMGR